MLRLSFLRSNQRSLRIDIKDFIVQTTLVIFDPTGIYMKVYYEAIFPSLESSSFQSLASEPKTFNHASYPSLPKHRHRHRHLPFIASNVLSSITHQPATYVQGVLN